MREVAHNNTNNHTINVSKVNTTTTSQSKTPESAPAVLKKKNESVPITIGQRADLKSTNSSGAIDLIQKKKQQVIGTDIQTKTIANATVTSAQ